MKKKITGFLLAFIMVFAMCEPVDECKAMADRQETSDIGIDKFSCEMNEIYEEYDIGKSYIPIPVEELDSSEYIYQTSRLVVKSDREIKDKDALEIVGPYNDIYVLQYGDAETAEKKEAYYSTLSYVEFVQPDRVIEANSIDDTLEQIDVDSIIAAADTVDWAPQVCRYDKLQEVLMKKYGSVDNMPEIIVADIDSGIYEAHKEFNGRIYPGGKSFVGDSSSINDTNGHGTATAGCIAMNTFSNVKILPIRLFYENEPAYTDTGTYDCIEYAVSMGVDVINMSFGHAMLNGETDPLEVAACKDAIAAGIILVAAHGNNGMELDCYYPACCDDVLAITAIDNKLKQTKFTNYGGKAFLSAPGADIYTTNRSTNGYRLISGTSFSCPYVTAGVALLLTYNPKLNLSQIKTILSNNVIDLGEEGWDKVYGYGALCFAEIESYLNNPSNDMYTHEVMDIKYEPNGGKSVANAKVIYGAKASAPTTLKEGYHFVGWYTDKGLTKLYNFNTPVTSNLTLYAKWEKHIYNDSLVYKKDATYTENGYKLYTCVVCKKATMQVKIDMKKLKKPSNLRASKASGKIKLSWKKVTGCSGYIIYRRVGSGKWKLFKKINNINTLKYVDKSVKNKKSYTYKICAYNKVQKTAFTTSKKITVKK